MERENEMEILLHINYTDGEMLDKRFETLGECLGYLTAEIAEKDEFADLLLITCH